MEVQIMSAGVLPAYTINDGILSVGDLVLDLAAMQADLETVFTVYQDGERFSLDSPGNYAIQARIPARRYRLVESTSLDIDGTPTVGTTQEPLPLDIDSVQIKLWGQS